MSTYAIRVEQLGKRYKVGGPSRSYNTIRETITDAFRAPRKRASSSDEENHFWALKDISFDVPKGDVVGIIGRNGAGKSTLLKVLARITEPTEGRAEVRGRVGSLLEVGTGFHPELTGRENVYLSGAILGMKRAEIQRKFDQIMSFAEVDRFVDTPLKHYSSGMYLRLAFAVAAHLEPAILMVDEVLAVGDLSFQRKCMGKMQEVGESGQTVLFVSHDLTAISRLATRSIVLQGGKILFYGPTSEAIRLYAEYRQNPGETLANRKDRTGDGVIQLTSITFHAPDGRDIAALGCGDPLMVAVGYTSRLPRLDYGDLALDMRVTDMLGHPITTFSTRFCNFEGDGRLNSSGTLYCTIPSMALASETYAIDLWLAYKGAVADFVVRAGEIQIVTSPYFETGQEPVKRKHGAALMKHAWSASATAPRTPRDAALTVIQS